MNLTALLPAGANVRSLPSAKNPRLYFSGANPIRRWQETALYPAFRPAAQAYRLLLRIKASLGLCKTCINLSPDWVVYHFTKELFPRVSSTVILVGTPGPSQKITVQVWEHGKVIAYLKYAEKPAARNRLANEHSMLKALPEGLGPTVLKYGPLENGMGLLTSPVVGRVLPAKLPIDTRVCNLYKRLEISSPRPIETHPWIQMVRTRYGQLMDPWLEVLGNRRWPIVIQHGDFSPWNIHQSSKNELRAIDWEYGTLKGFPYLDLVYYILQVAALIYHWSPHDARYYAVSFLNNSTWMELSATQAKAVVSLAAFNAYQQFLLDGHASNTSTQTWWHSVWMSKI